MLSMIQRIDMETSGNGLVKTLVIGVAVLVLAAVIIGSGTSTIANTIGRNVLEVEINTVKQRVDEQATNVAKIPVMDERIKDIKEDVGKILEALNK